MNSNPHLHRFALVGIINTTLDAGMFSVLHSNGLTIFTANLCSTSLGLASSFVLNSRYTFNNKPMTRQRVIAFLVVTLIGLWVLQPIIIAGLVTLNQHVHITQPLTSLFGHATILDSLLPKLAAVAITLVWNFLWYSRVIYV